MNLSGHNFYCAAVYTDFHFPFRAEIHQRKEVVKTCILGLKHIYKDKTNVERYDIALSNIKEIFDRRKLSISEFEIKLLINEVCEENDCSHIE